MCAIAVWFKPNVEVLRGLSCKNPSVKFRKNSSNGCHADKHDKANMGISWLNTNMPRKDMSKISCDNGAKIARFCNEGNKLAFPCFLYLQNAFPMCS
jgi:hypothetical protein